MEWSKVSKYLTDVYCSMFSKKNSGICSSLCISVHQCASGIYSKR